MTERVSVHVSIYDGDAVRFCEVYGEEPEMTTKIGPNGWVEMDFGAIAGAGEEERKEAAKLGIRFFGYHHACDDHPAAIFCSDGDGELYSWLGMKVYDGFVRPVSVWTLDKDKLEAYAEPHDGLVTVFQELYTAAWAPPPDEEELDFGGMLEARLDCLNNETIIREMSFHDTENVDLLLDYIRVLLRKVDDERRERRETEDPRGWIGFLDRPTIEKVHDAATRFLNNMRPMTTNPRHTASAAHLRSVTESIVGERRTDESDLPHQS